MIPTAPQAVADLLGLTVQEVKAARRKPTSYFVAALFDIGGRTYCSPRRGLMPPRSLAWEIAGTYQGRVVFRAQTGR